MLQDISIWLVVAFLRCFNFAGSSCVSIRLVVALHLAGCCFVIRLLETFSFGLFKTFRSGWLLLCNVLTWRLDGSRRLDSIGWLLRLAGLFALFAMRI